MGTTAIGSWYYDLLELAGIIPDSIKNIVLPTVFYGVVRICGNDWKWKSLDPDQQLIPAYPVGNGISR